MSELRFSVQDARPERFGAAPTLLFDVEVEETSGSVLHSIALRSQIRIEPQKRRYDAAEEARLLELFGESPRWGDTLRPFVWTHVSHMVPGFEGHTRFDLPVACTYDFDVSAAKYLHALDGGSVPLRLLFSGTAFARGPAGVQVEPVPWDREASFEMPVATWRGLMDEYFPNSGWLRLRRDTLDALSYLKATRALATWDEVVEELLAAHRERRGS